MPRWQDLDQGRGRVLVTTAKTNRIGVDLIEQRRGKGKKNRHTQHSHCWTLKAGKVLSAMVSRWLLLGHGPGGKLIEVEVMIVR